MQSQSFCMISYKATSLFMIIQYAANRPWIWYLICILSHTDNKFNKFVLQLSWHCCFKQEVQSLWLPTSWDKAMINLQSPRNLRCCCTDYFQYTCCNRFFTWFTLFKVSGAYSIIHCIAVLVLLVLSCCHLQQCETISKWNQVHQGDKACTLQVLNATLKI